MGGFEKIYSLMGGAASNDFARELEELQRIRHIRAARSTLLVGRHRRRRVLLNGLPHPAPDHKAGPGAHSPFLDDQI